MVASGWVHAQTVLTPDQPVAGTLAAGGTIQVDLETRAGDYLAGDLDIPTSDFRLELVDRNGAAIRRLVSEGDNRRLFQFVAPAEPVALRLSGASGGDYALSLVRQVARADQQSPEPDYRSPTVARLAAELAGGDDVDALWRAISERGTPLEETGPDGETLLTFLYRGARHNARVVGSPSGDHAWMKRLGTTDIWYHSFEVPADTRLSYQIAPDIPEFDGTDRERRVALLATAQADPLNRHPWPTDAPDVYNRKSTVALSKAPAQPWLAARDVPHGELRSYRFASEALGNERDVMIYRPPGFQPDNPDNLLLVLFDAEAYTTTVPTPTILDNMIAEGVIPPVVAVFVANPDLETRGRELPANPDFAKVMAEDLVPWVAQETGLEPTAARTILSGSSYGGLASTTIALAYPQVFGNVLGMSSSFWWSPPGTPAEEQEYVARELVDMPARPVRFFLSAGLFERQHAGAAGILETNRHVRDLLQAKGFDVRYREYAGAHDYLIWRGVLSDGLLALADMAGW
ncbi:enterochelin esterase [Marinobacter bohaiensis]|uniref:enterochelin esterase n=1 Tax=Marinobacter bohaiensis TaxID=2201898 RepID=UPI0013A6ACD8|nr:enterochelin esterase [Marinobacter bohaiensis]